jgi:hypothetical protein
VKHRWLWLVIGLVTLEVGVFYLRHDDVVALSRSADSWRRDRPSPARQDGARREQVTRRCSSDRRAASRQQDRALRLAALNASRRSCRGPVVRRYGRRARAMEG